MKFKIYLECIASFPFFREAGGGEDGVACVFFPLKKMKESIIQIQQTTESGKEKKKKIPKLSYLLLPFP